MSVMWRVQLGSAAAAAAAAREGAPYCGRVRVLRLSTAAAPAGAAGPGAGRGAGAGAGAGAGEAAVAPPRTAAVRVATYNILTPAYARPNYFQYAPAAALVPSARLARVLEKLAPEVAARAVVCLQEVPRTEWAGALHTYFAAAGYTFVLASYGYRDSDYFGVGLAVPREFELLEARLARPAQAKEWPEAAEPPRAAAPAGWRGALDVLGRALRKAAALVAGGGGRGGGDDAGGAGRGPRRAKETWVDAKERPNTMVMARLRCARSGVEFCAGTYHMPCAFYNPPLMVIHTALCAQMMQVRGCAVGGGTRASALMGARRV